MKKHLSLASIIPIKICIADDHQMFIDGLRSLLNLEPSMDVVAVAKNGRELIDLIPDILPDIVLTDVKMPIMDGIEVTRWIKQHYPQIKVIALSMFHNLALIKKMLKAGANGYILKNTGKEELYMSIYTVMKNKPYFSENISDKVMRSMMTSLDDMDEGTPHPISLTRRELEILELIVDENTSAEIAGKLFISINTVETHRKNLLHKLKAKNTVGLVKYAYENNLFN